MVCVLLLIGMLVVSAVCVLGAPETCHICVCRTPKTMNREQKQKIAKRNPKFGKCNANKHILTPIPKCVWCVCGVIHI